jgi:hypothetical protein
LAQIGKGSKNLKLLSLGNWVAFTKAYGLGKINKALQDHIYIEITDKKLDDSLIILKKSDFDKMKVEKQKAIKIVNQEFQAEKPLHFKIKYMIAKILNSVQGQIELATNMLDEKRLQQQKNEADELISGILKGVLEQCNFGISILNNAVKKEKES